MAIEKFVVGKSYKWSGNTEDEDYFVVDDVRGNCVYYTYPEWENGTGYSASATIISSRLSEAVEYTPEKENTVQEVKVGQVWNWFAGNETKANFEVVSINKTGDFATIQYLDGDTRDFSLENWFDTKPVLIKDVEETKLEIKPGQKFERVGAWLDNFMERSVVEVAYLFDDEGAEKVRMVHGGRDEASVFFSSKEDFERSGASCGYFLIEDSPEGDSVEYPAHYTSDPSGVECIQITRHRNFNIGNAIKYLWRAGLKKDGNLSDKEKEIQDLKKAVWYINDEIAKLEAK